MGFLQAILSVSKEYMTPVSYGEGTELYSQSFT